MDAKVAADSDHHWHWQVIVLYIFRVCTGIFCILYITLFSLGCYTAWLDSGSDVCQPEFTIVVNELSHGAARPVPLAVNQNKSRMPFRVQCPSRAGPYSGWGGCHLLFQWAMLDLAGTVAIQHERSKISSLSYMMQNTGMPVVFKFKLQQYFSASLRRLLKL